MHEDHTNDVVSNKAYFQHDLALRVVKVTNLLIMTCVFALTWQWFYADKIVDPFYNVGNWVMFGLFMIMYFFYGRTYDAFVVSLSSVSEKVYSQILSCLFTDVVMFVVIGILTRHFPVIWPMIICILVQAICSYLWSTASHKWYFRRYPARQTIAVYSRKVNLKQLLDKYGLENKFNVQKIVQVGDCLANDLSELSKYEVVFLVNIQSPQKDQLVKYCIAHNINLYILPDIGDVIMSGAQRMHILHLPVLQLSRYRPTPEFVFVKRAFDIISAGTLLILLSPIFLLVALAIKITDHGPVFYRQVRLTKNGCSFNILKFRSMRVDAEEDGVARLSTGDGDKRVTPVGKFIRKVRFDEIPQLLNIIKGDMSVVGPRPERPEIAEQYERELPEFHLRLQAKAGLTGYAQVYGQYNTTPYNKLEMDLMYISNPSVFEDLKIIFATVKILFKADSTEGVEPDKVTAEDQRL